MSLMSFFPVTRLPLVAGFVIAGIAWISTFLCNLLLALFTPPEVLLKLFYLPWFLFLTFAGLWSAVLFRIEARALLRSLMNSPRIALVAQLGVLAVAAAILISYSDFAFESAGTSAMGTVLKGEVIWRRAWATNSLILLAVYALTLALTRRLVLTLILVSPLYSRVRACERPEG